MSIEFSCAGCGKLLRVPESSSGGRATCPSCGGLADVPLLEAIYLDEPEVIMEAEVLEQELPSGHHSSRFHSNQYSSNPFRQDGMLHPASIPTELTGTRQSDGNGLWIVLLAGGVFASIGIVVVASLVTLVQRPKAVGVPRQVANRSPADFQPTAPDFRHIPQMPTMRELPQMPQLPQMPELPTMPQMPEMPTMPGPAVPSPPPFPTFGSNQQATVTFEIQSYSGNSVAQARAAALSALAALHWVDLSRLSIDLEAGELVVAVRGRSVSTAAAKAALEGRGFQIGATRFSTPGQVEDPSVRLDPWERTNLGFGGLQRRGNNGEVVFEMTAYHAQRGLPARFQVRSALLRLRWVDPTRILVDPERSLIVVGTRPTATAVDPQAAKAFLEKAGFEIESAQYFPEGRPDADRE